jgi:hypothetical protein
MIEPTEAHITALGNAMWRRRGFRQLLDEITFQDQRSESEIPEDEEWTPEQYDVLRALAEAVLNAQEVE